MQTQAVIIQEPQRLALSPVTLCPAVTDDVTVDMEWTGISTGTEKLLWSGQMPPFPGLAYPLVPGYESVGRVTRADGAAAHLLGQRVFVPGARCYGEVRALFGGASARVMVDAARVVPIAEQLGENGVLMALAATAYHATQAPFAAQPDLIVGHGVVGRLLARLALAAGAPPPTVWEKVPIRRAGAVGYPVVHPDDDDRRDYHSIYDASGDASLLNTLIGRLAPGGEIVLAGFYAQPLSFHFPPAFMREARLRVAAEWRAADLSAVSALIAAGTLNLDVLITHHSDAREAPAAYATAFGDPACLKMILDWRNCS